MFTVFRTWQRWPSSLWRETQKRSILPWWPWVKWIEYSPSPLPRIPAYWCNAWNYFTGIICLSASFEALINFLTFGTVHKHCFLWIRCCCHNLHPCSCKDQNSSLLHWFFFTSCHKKGILFSLFTSRKWSGYNFCMCPFIVVNFISSF